MAIHRADRDALRDELLRVLRLAFPDEDELRAFLAGAVADAAGSASQAAPGSLDVGLAVEEIVAHDRVDALAEALRAAAPALDTEVEALLDRAAAARGPRIRLDGLSHYASPPPGAFDPREGPRQPGPERHPHPTMAPPVGATRDPAPVSRDLVLAEPGDEGDGTATASLAALPPQHVNHGFASTDAPGTPLADRTLAAGRAYVFWVEIAAERIAGAAGAAPALRSVAAGDVVDVIVFGFPGQLTVGDANRARVRLEPTGHVVLEGPRVAVEAARLGFDVRTPDSPGTAALRCNVYARGVLLQSHLVKAAVARVEEPRAGAVRSDLDYNLTSSLDPRRLGGDDCKLSVFVNDDERGTHSFRFVSSTAGVPDQIREAHVDGSALRRMVDFARQALRWSAWGTIDPWRGDADVYKFAGPFDRVTLVDALRVLAIRGANLYMEIAKDFGFGPGAAKELRAHMRTPGRVQIALKRSPDAIIPTALVYDYPIDTALPDPRPCEAALAAIAAGTPLVDEPCFRGACPEYGTRDVFCPGGFWGFRHDLGLPIHLPHGEVASTIARGAALRAFAPVSLDPAFVMRQAHLDALAALDPGWLEILDDRAEVLDRLHEARQIVYFYCHGGVTREDSPYLRVGALDSPDLLAQSFFDADISWPDPLRPLVILNGCHTTATSPDAMFSMLTAFAVQGNAAGVLGTEITNFEPVAVAFGSAFLHHFLAGVELGRAVRLARLELLRTGNPLGLMYIPFALPSLKLV